MGGDCFEEDGTCEREGDRLGVGTHEVHLLVWCNEWETKEVNTSNSPADAIS